MTIPDDTPKWWREAAASFASYHAEHAGYGGAGFEFHARAQTFAGDMLELLDEHASLRARVTALEAQHERAADMFASGRRYERALEVLHGERPASDTSWLEDRIADLEQQLEAERDRRIEAERPAAVLAEAERLLRATPLFAVCFDDMFVGADWWTERDGEDAMDCGQFDTLAEAYAALRKERNDG